MHYNSQFNYLNKISHNLAMASVVLMMFGSKGSVQWLLEVLKSGDKSKSHEGYSGTEDIGIVYFTRFWGRFSFLKKKMCNLYPNLKRLQSK